MQTFLEYLESLNLKGAAGAGLGGAAVYLGLQNTEDSPERDSPSRIHAILDRKDEIIIKAGKIMGDDPHMKAGMAAYNLSDGIQTLPVIDQITALEAIEHLSKNKDVKRLENLANALKSDMPTSMKRNIIKASHFEK